MLNQELTWDPTNILGLLYRGQIMLETGYPITAYNDFNKAAYLLTHRPTAHIWLAKSLLELKQTEQAKALLTKIVAEHPDNQEAKKMLDELK